MTTTGAEIFGSFREQKIGRASLFLCYVVWLDAAKWITCTFHVLSCSSVFTYFKFLGCKILLSNFTRYTLTNRFYSDEMNFEKILFYNKNILFSYVFIWFLPISHNFFIRFVHGAYLLWNNTHGLPLNTPNIRRNMV